LIFCCICFDLSSTSCSSAYEEATADYTSDLYPAKLVLLDCFLSFAVFQLQAQTKVVGECAITYDIHQISMKGDTSLVGQKQIFIKGNSCKTILKTPAFTQTLIFNTQQDTAIILKEFGMNKFLQYILYAF
jgi:hypothetical protein